MPITKIISFNEKREVFKYDLSFILCSLLCNLKYSAQSWYKANVLVLPTKEQSVVQNKNPHFRAGHPTLYNKGHT